MTYNVHDIHPKIPALPGEAQQIEVVRTSLLLESEEVRLGHDHYPSRAATHLAQAALSFAGSKAPEFEKLHTLNAVHANLLGGGVKRWNMRTVAGLSRQALNTAYPKTTDRSTNELNRLEIAARRRAIRHTTPEIPFTLALEQAWDHLGHPIEPLIQATEAKVLEAYRARIYTNRIRQLTTDTGALEPYNPFDED